MVIGRSVFIEPKLVANSTWPEKLGGDTKSILPNEVTTVALISGGAEGEQAMSILPLLDLAVRSADVI